MVVTGQAFFSTPELPVVTESQYWARIYEYASRLLMFPNQKNISGWMVRNMIETNVLVLKAEYRMSQEHIQQIYDYAARHTRQPYRDIVTAYKDITGEKILYLLKSDGIDADRSISFPYARYMHDPASGS